MTTIHTPWGTPQHSKRLAPGITEFETASHGGYLVAGDAFARMPLGLQAVPTYAGRNVYGTWYEEDQDAAIVVLAFPELFNDYLLLCAVETGLSSWSGREPNMPLVAKWLREDPIGVALRERAESWRAANGHLYRTGSASTGGKGWTVHAHRLDESEDITIQFDERVPALSMAETIKTGYYALRSPFDEARVTELGGRIVQRAPARRAA